MISYLKQILLVVLVLSTLGYSSAWAFDEHVLEPLEVELTDLSSSTDDALNDTAPDNQNNNDIACDHCGHISSHLIAIFLDSICTASSGTSIYLLSLNEGINSFISGPDLEPPRV
ncbi:hypothetical protein MNBD_GAMMA05-2330 [hydrothermal vent metagenome]|uniref:Uncharacterized protein n=1 Tax=hydrothermal vent metagenome TaxID=652676 RepID=A0A3B0WPN6_9ZZZZ